MNKASVRWPRVDRTVYSAYHGWQVTVNAAWSQGDFLTRTS
jgi:hypothetical protein